MKAQELRIGNLLSYNGTVVQVSNIGSNGFETTKDGVLYGSCNLESYDPIPLTEQWLIDFGLLKKPNHKYFHIKGMDFHIPIMSGGYYDNEYGMDEENRITLFYVHQLQNLYFALTGEELQL